MNPHCVGTKAAAHYTLIMAPGATQLICLRLSNLASLAAPFADLAALRQRRLEEADEFYHKIAPLCRQEDMRHAQRQAFAGLLWSKQYYRFNVTRWLEGNPMMPQPAPGHRFGRNHQWPPWMQTTLSPCPINRNIPGLRPGIWRFTAFPWRSSTLSLPSTSWIS